MKEFVCDICGVQFKAKRFTNLKEELGDIPEVKFDHDNTPLNDNFHIGIEDVEKSPTRGISQPKNSEKANSNTITIRKIHKVSEIQPGDDDMRCEICGKQHKNRSSLTQHVLKTHGDSKCPHCGTCFKLESLRNHMKMEHPGQEILEETTSLKPFQCQDCGARYMGKKSLNVHRVNKHGARKMRASTKYSKLYDRCRIFVNNEKKYKCDICNRMYNKTTNLLHHYSVHKTNEFADFDKVGFSDFDIVDISGKSTCEVAASDIVSVDLAQEDFSSGLTQATSSVSAKINNVDSKAPRSHANQQICINSSIDKLFSDEILEESTLLKPFECQDCGAKYKNRKSLNAHRFRKHGVPFSRQPTKYKGLFDRCRIYFNNQKRYKCDICNRMYKMTGSLISHYSIHNVEFEGERVDAENTSNAGLAVSPDSSQISSDPLKIDNLDLKAVTSISSKPIYGGSRIKCNICSCRLPNESLLLWHRFKRHIFVPPSKFKCLVCDKQFEEFNLLKRHSFENHPKEPLPVAFTLPGSFKCSNCDSEFRTKSNLNKHIRSKHRELASTLSTKSDGLPLRCGTCKNVFADRKQLLRHRKNEHGGRPSSITKKWQEIRERCHITSENNSSYKCDVCSKLYHSYKIFQQHYCENHLGKRCCCETCGKTFRSRHNLHIHRISVHEKLKEHVCPECGMRFALKSNMEKHKLLHSDVRRFTCDVCGKAFKEKVSLTKHLTTHTEPTHKCRFCPKVFKSIGNLKSHLVTHTGERRYVCKVCGDSFAYRSILNHHMARHDDTRRFSCQICSATFKLKKYVTQHMRTHERK